MKNFFELLVTDYYLDININGSNIRAGIKDRLEFNIHDTVTIDGYEILPRYQYLATDGVLKIDEPFYCWHHRVSGQGWLLSPY